MASPDVGHEGALEEFRALRSEIDRRSVAQQALMGLLVTGAGIVTTVVFTEPDNIAALLVLPLLSFVIGVQWYDHHVYIHVIGGYIGTILHPRVPGGLGWELWERTTVHRRDRLIGLVAGYGVFPLVSAAALIVLAVRAVSTSVPAWAAIAWSIGLVALLWQVWTLARTIRGVEYR